MSPVPRGSGTHDQRVPAYRRMPVHAGDLKRRRKPAETNTLAGGMRAPLNLNRVDMILLLTAFAAGTVDVIGFATLGGVFASAMTGNFALLAYYVAQSDAAAAVGSMVALSGFVSGCALGMLQRRSRPQEQALSILLMTETALLLCYALYAIWMPHAADAASNHLQILLLAVAMGIQAVIGQTISLTTIVFTTTLTKLVGAIADSLANGHSRGLKDVKIQSAVVVSYLFGALLAGALTLRRADAVAVLPFTGLALAYAAYRFAPR